MGGEYPILHLCAVCSVPWPLTVKACLSRVKLILLQTFIHFTCTAVTDNKQKLVNMRTA